MAELSQADRRAIMGENYTEPTVTQESLDGQRAAKRTSLRNAAIGIAIVVAIILVASYFR